MVFYLTALPPWRFQRGKAAGNAPRRGKGAGRARRELKKVRWKRGGERGGCGETAKSTYGRKDRKDGGSANRRERRREAGGGGGGERWTRRTRDERKEENARDRGLLLARLPVYTMHPAPSVTALLCLFLFRSLTISRFLSLFNARGKFILLGAFAYLLRMSKLRRDRAIVYPLQIIIITHGAIYGESLLCK